MNCIAVIDFETTGLSPTMGDRATQGAIVMQEDGKVVLCEAPSTCASTTSPHQ